jgi:hypothetical protein
MQVSLDGILTSTIGTLTGSALPSIHDVGGMNESYYFLCGRLVGLPCQERTRSDPYHDRLSDEYAVHHQQNVSVRYVFFLSTRFPIHRNDMTDLPHDGSSRYERQ